MYNVGDWVWLIGSVGGGVLYFALSVRILDHGGSGGRSRAGQL